jgi:hypothetical protein
VKVARPVREGGTGKRIGGNANTAPRADPHRPHRALGQAAPLRPLPDNVIDLETLRVQRRDRAGRLLHEYQHVA